MARAVRKRLFLSLLISHLAVPVAAASASPRHKLDTDRIAYLSSESAFEIQNLHAFGHDLRPDLQDLSITSGGHFQLGRRHIMRRSDEVMGLGAEDALLKEPQHGDLDNATERAASIGAAIGHEIVASPFDGLFKDSLDSPVRIGLATGCIGLVIAFIVMGVLFCTWRPPSREELRKREEAAIQIQKRVRGNRIRTMLKREQQTYDHSHGEVLRRRSTVLLREDEEINERFLKLRPHHEGQSAAAEKDYQTMVHTMSYDELAQVLNSRINSSDNYKCMTEPAGLRQEQAVHYMKFHGPNKITPAEHENIWIKLLKMIFGGLFNILLWFCVFAQIVLIRVKMIAHPDKPKKVEEFITPAFLTLVIIAAATLQWYTEMQAENMMESVQNMQSDQKVRVVRRDGEGRRVDEELDPEMLVPGDVIFLEAGLRIPADVRILHCTEGMEVDNSALTGESMPEPRVPCVEGDAVPVMEARNVAYCGTTVLQGNATCMVHSTGDLTFLGKIAAGLKGPRTLSTLELQIEHFVHIVAIVSIAVGLLSIAANMLSPVRRSIADILENSSTALFAQVPEGLLPTVTISLMIASKQLSTRNVLVRKLDAVETLGCVSVICSDKTGTLTTGEMSAVSLIVPHGSTPLGRPSQLGAMNPLERLEPKAGQIQNLEVAARNDGTFDSATTSSRNFQSLCMCGLLNNAAVLSGVPEVQGDTPIAPGGSREWTERWKATGSPTEVAILRASVECLGGLAGAMQIRGEYGLVYEVPFNSKNKWMLTIHTHPQAPADRRYQCILKGAPEVVLSKCNLRDDERSQIDETLNQLMSRGLRVLCFATRSISESQEGLPNFKDAESSGTGSSSEATYPTEDYNFVGLVSIEDPPKKGVAEAVLTAHAAGVKVVMVTGDHPETAKAIAGRINILPQSGLSGEASDFAVIPGTSLEGKLPIGDGFSADDPEEICEWWRRAVTHTCVFARVSPIHKQVIVQAYQYFGKRKIGDIVAMTGDGVNDAPALKMADVGVAMGIRGTEVAKDAADIVLLDDDFASIVSGMEQGRLASDNLQKSIMYTLCSKVPQVAPTFAEILGIPMALNALQVLLIDIGTDIWTAIAYAMQPAESALMQVPPRHPYFEKIVNWKVLIYSYCYIGQLQMLLCWIFYLTTPGITSLIGKAHFDKDEKLIHRTGMTVYYWTLVIGQIAAAISTTTKSQHVFGRRGYGFPNNLLNVLLVLEVVLGFAVIYLKPLNMTFGTAPLNPLEVSLPLVAIPIICAIDEVRKAVVRSQTPIAVAHESVPA